MHWFHSRRLNCGHEDRATTRPPSEEAATTVPTATPHGYFSPFPPHCLHSNHSLVVTPVDSSFTSRNWPPDPLQDPHSLFATLVS